MEDLQGLGRMYTSVLSFHTLSRRVRLHLLLRLFVLECFILLNAVLGGTRLHVHLRAVFVNVIERNLIACVCVCFVCK